MRFNNLKENEKKKVIEKGFETNIEYLKNNNVRSNNLQIMKFIAAVLVIFSHSFPICTGEMNGEILYQLTQKQMSFGGLAVSIFFFCSGYFVTRSAMKQKNALEFFKVRCKRIFPQLWIVVICTIIIGSVISSLSFWEYYKDYYTWLYLLNGVLIPIHNLPGVLNNAIYLPTVNGALWTLSVEFFCYIICYIFCKFKQNFYKAAYFIIIICGFGLSYVLPQLLQVVRPVLLFLVGMIYFINKEKILDSGKYLIIMIILSVVLFTTKLNLEIMLICFPHFCHKIWFSKMQINDEIAKLGNLSYGMYLTAFPIQQILANSSFNIVNPFVNTIVTLLISITFAYVLNFFIDRKIYLKKQTNYLKINCNRKK